MNTRQTEIINEALEDLSVLNDWEYNFAIDLADYEGNLSHNQDSKLEEIADKLGI